MMSPYVRVSTCRKTALGIWIKRLSPSTRFSLVGWNQVVKVLLLTLAFTLFRNVSQRLVISPVNSVCCPFADVSDGGWVSAVDPVRPSVTGAVVESEDCE